MEYSIPLTLLRRTVYLSTQLPQFRPLLLNHVLALHHLSPSSSALLPLSLLARPWRSPSSLRHLNSLSITVRFLQTNIATVFTPCHHSSPPFLITLPLCLLLPWKLSPSSTEQRTAPSCCLHSVTPLLPQEERCGSLVNFPLIYHYH